MRLCMCWAVELVASNLYRTCLVACVWPDCIAAAPVDKRTDPEHHQTLEEPLQMSLVTALITQQSMLSMLEHIGSTRPTVIRLRRILPRRQLPQQTDMTHSARAG